MLDDRLHDLCITEDATIRASMRAIDAGAAEISLVLSHDGRLLGTVTDGDIRRALLEGASLDDPVAPIVNRVPKVVGASSGRAEVLDLMQAQAISQVPVVDANGRLIGLHLVRELLARRGLPIAAVIMAGGMGRRLGPLTEHTPKPMLPVAGRPILERLVLHLVGWGVRRVYLAVNYLAEVIERHFGDGSGFGCSIDYLRETEPLGTAGALALLPAHELARPHPLLVLNGDLITNFAVQELLAAHERYGGVATLAVRDHFHRVPFGVVVRSGDHLAGIDEKPVVSWEVSAGIAVIQPALVSRIPRNRACDLPQLLVEAVEGGSRVGIWPMTDEWDDVGRPDDLYRARGLV